MLFTVQCDLVSTHLDCGRPVEEQDIEDAFELLYKINEMSGLEYGLGIVSFITPLLGDLITVLLVRYAFYRVAY